MAAGKQNQIRSNGDDGWRTNTPLVPRIFEFSILSESPSFGSFSRRHNQWISFGSSYCENSWRTCHQSQIQWTHLTSFNPEKQSVSWMKFMITRKSSGPVTNCSETFKDQEVNSMKKKHEPRASRKLVLALSTFHLQEHPNTQNEPFLRMRGNGRSFRRIFRWRILGSCIIQDGSKNAGTLLWYSNKSRIDEIIPGGKETGLDKHSSLHLWTHSETIRKKKNLSYSSQGTLSNISETQWRCGILVKIIKSAGSRIAILANKIICNDHVRHSARRLRWSCDFSERRSSNFRMARDTKASTHVKG